MAREDLYFKDLKQELKNRQMGKDERLEFEANILSGAVLNPNPQEFYSRAYLNEDIVDNFRTLAGIKHETKIAYVTFGNVLKASTCAFSDVAANLGAVTINVSPLSAMVKLCQFDLEQSWLSEQMAKGSNASFVVASFMTFFWNELASEIAEEIEMIRWQGNKQGTFDEDEAYLVLADGYEKKLTAAETGTTATFSGGTGTAATVTVQVGKKGAITGVTVTDGGDYSVAPTGVVLANTGEGEGATFTIQTSGSSPNIEVTGVTVVTAGTAYTQRVVKVTGTTLTASNILTEMAKVFSAMPRAIRRRKDLLRWHLSPVAADFYRQATAVGNNVSYITKSLDLTYLDIKLVVGDGVSDNKMILTRRDNLIYAFDGAGDAKELKLVDMNETAAEPEMRARTNMKVGFHLVNESEIVYYA